MKRSRISRLVFLSASLLRFLGVATICFSCLSVGSEILAADNTCHVKIGFVLPLTGPASLIGERSEQAAQLALSSLPENLQSRISLVFEDTEMKPSVGLRATMKLIADPSVIGLSGFGSETVSAIVDILERRKITGVFVTPDRKPLLGKSYLFRHWVDGSDLQAVLAPILKAKGLRKIALVYSELPAMLGFADTLSDSAKSLGLEVVSKQNLLPAETDFRTVISSTLRSKPDAIFFFFLPPQISNFMKQLRVADRNTPVYSYINTENSYEVTAANGMMDGIVYAGPTFTPEFIAAFSARYHEYPEFASGNIYDIVQMFALAVQSGACTGEEVQKRIAELHDFDGALGHYGVTDVNDFRFPVRPKIIRDGKFEFLK